MSEQEKHEKIEWVDKNKATVEIIESVPIKNEKGELIGTSEMKNKHTATREDFEKGLEIVAERIAAEKKKLDKSNSQLVVLGKKPVMTGELATVEKALNKIMKLRQINKVESEKKQIEDQLNDLEKMKKRNTDALKNAPK